MAHEITGGVWPAVLTCWDDDHDRPDPTQQAKLIDGFARDQVGGLYVLGSTGRGIALGHEHRKEITQTIAKANDSRLPLMVHVGAVSAFDGADLARHAADCGADAISAVPPIYFPADFDTIFEHYRIIAAATDLPFFPYHHSGLGVAMPDAPEYTKRLLDLPNIRGIKFTSSDLFTFMRIRKYAGDDLVMFSGADELMCMGALADSDGAIGSFYNMFCKAFQTIRGRFQAGEVDAARQFSLVFADVLDDILFPRKKIRDFMRAAMRLRYGVEIGKNRSGMDLFGWDWSDDDVQAILDRVDQAAGL